MSRSLDESTLYRLESNTVVVASAGTGKTHALVGVILHALLGATALAGKGKPVHPRRLIATTFSRKAGAEIRVRVVRELERISASVPSPYDAALLENHPHPDKLASLARRALDQIGRAQIGTLHAFATSLVKAHALELGLPLGLEFESEQARRERLHDSVLFATESMNVSHPREIRALVDAENGIDSFVSAVGSFLVRLEEDGGSASSLVIRDDSEAIESWRLELVEHARFFSESGNRAAAAVAAGDLSPDSIREMLQSIKGGAGLQAKRPRYPEFLAEIQRRPSDTKRETADTLGALFGSGERVRECSTVLRELVVRAQRRFHESSRSDSVVGFSDVLRLARDLLRDHPDVATEIGGEYDALLVDECQDTSRVQSELVQLLWADKKHRRVRGVVPDFSSARSTGLFVVGDRKQSIYGFRGADVSIFAEIVVGLAGRTAQRALHVPDGAVRVPESPSAQFFSLVTNRRGEPELLAFANEFSRRRFVPEEPPLLFEISYVPETEDLVAPAAKAPVPGLCRTEWLKLGDAQNSDLLSEGKAIAVRILEMVRSGQPARRDGRRVQYKDVAVLAHTNGMLDAAAYALAEFDVPYVVAGRGFYASREVRDLAAMLALILNPNDTKALLTVLRGVWTAAHDASLLGLSDGKRGLLRLGRAWDDAPRRNLVRASDETGLRRVREVVETLGRNVDRLGPGGLLRAASDALEFEETLVLLPRGAQRVANARKLLSLADRETDPRRFVATLDELATLDSTESEAATFSESDDAVRLLTVHASKGLDFPVVFIPELGRTGRPRSRRVAELGIGVGANPNEVAIRLIDSRGRSIETPSYRRLRKEMARRDQAERQRLAYVAVTRASSHMVFVGFKKEARDSKVSEACASNMDILRQMAAVDEVRSAAHLSVREMSPAEIADVKNVRTGIFGETESPFVRSVPTVRRLPIAPTSLQDFYYCARRFQLVHLMAFPERHSFRRGTPVEGPTADRGAVSPEREGTLAHAVLERVSVGVFGGEGASREAEELLTEEGLPPQHPSHQSVLRRVLGFLEGGYAGRIQTEGARVVREKTFSFAVLGNAAAPDVLLRGTIDLLVEWPDGSVDVVDYKRARGADPNIHAFQLDLYTLAVRDAYPAATAIRRGIVFLGGDASEPKWLQIDDLDRVAGSVVELGLRLVQARLADSFARAPETVCERIRCGYFERCYGERSAEENPPSATTT